MRKSIIKNKNVLIDIVNHIEKHTNKSIFIENNKPETVAYKVIYAILAIENSNLSLREIGAWINRGHSNMVHYRDTKRDIVLSNEKYFNIYDSFVIGKQYKKPSYDRIQKMCSTLWDQNRKLSGIIYRFKKNNYIKPTKEDIIIYTNFTPHDYTQNELDYRLLTKEEQKIYNERIQPILKMMPSNQKRKEVFEVIACQS